MFSPNDALIGCLIIKNGKYHCGCHLTVVRTPRGHIIFQFIRKQNCKVNHKINKGFELNKRAV